MGEIFAATIAFLVVLTVLIGRRSIFSYVIVAPFQRGIITNKGVFEKAVSSGRYWVPRWKTLTAVDMRMQVLNVAGQEVLSSDGLSLKISIAGEYAVDDAEKSLYMATQPSTNLYLYAQSAIREVIGTQSFDEVLRDKSELSKRLLEIVQPQAALLGFAVQSLQIRDIMLSGELKRAFAQAITAQKDGLAALERARGETAALRSLANAARLMEESPALLQLRALQTMESTRGNTLVLGVGDPGLTIKPKT